MRKPKEQMPPERPMDEYETEADRLLAYAQFVADTKCGAVDLGDFFYEYSGDITLLVQEDKVVAHNMKTGTIQIALPTKEQQ
jgi:CRISPR/Cas system CMR-associated protein Cmr3 (group 5 of RAMP superfamily)